MKMPVFFRFFRIIQSTLFAFQTTVRALPRSWPVFNLRGRTQIFFRGGDKFKLAVK